MGRMGKNLKIKETQIFDITRKVIAYGVSSGWSEIPHATGTIYSDVSEFLKVFKEYNTQYNTKAHKREINVLKISLNSVMLKVMAEALKAAPEMNASLKYSKLTKTGSLSILESINITMPFLLPNGNITSPIIPDVGNKSIEEIARYTQDLQRKVKNTNFTQLLMDVAIKERASDLVHGKISTIPSIVKGLVGKHKIKNKLKGKAKKEYYNIPESERLIPEDILSGSITISNLGSVLRGTRFELNFSAIVAPQVCCIGINAIQKESIVIKNMESGVPVYTTEIRDVLPIVACFDHRAMDFAHVVPFIKKCEEIFANPQKFFEEHFAYSNGTHIDLISEIQEQISTHV